MRIAMLLHKSVEFDSRVRREASALVAAGHEVVVVELAPVPRDARNLDGFERRSVLPGPRLKRVLPFHLYRIAFAVSFVREVVRLNPDVVHAHDAAMLLPGAVGARLTGARLVYDSHELATSVPYRERSWAWFVGAIERLVVPRCAAVMTVSDGIAARLRERYRLPETPTVVRNVSALTRGGAGGLRRMVGLRADDPLVLYQGAPAPARGCEILVDAVGRLDGVHLVFLGDPEPGYGAELVGLIEERGLRGRVSLLPSVPLAELLSHTEEADVGVTLLQDTCENHRLALPNKLFEYIAAGVPVVASALPETERLVRHYDVGWCVSPADPVALADALGRALRERGDPERRHRLAEAAEQLHWSSEQRRLLELYERLGRGADQATAPLVLALVRNGVSTDARVLRAARTAQRIGARTLVIGVATERDPAGSAQVGGIDVVRLAPWGRRPDQRARPSAGTPAPAGAASTAPLATRTRLRRVAAGLSFAVQATRLGRKARPAIVHANDWNTMWAGLAIKLACRCPLIYDSHELWADRNGRWENRRWLLAAEALFARLADRVLVTSPGHGSVLAARCRIATPLVVRNIPEQSPALLSPAPAEPPVLAYVGGLMPGRGLEQALDALPLLSGFRLRAIGPGAGDYADTLRRRAAALGVADRLELLGPVAPDKIPAALGGALAGLCLIEPICRSYELCLPNKLFEYIAAGLPVIASDLPVIGQVVCDAGLGEVVAPTGVHALVAAVEQLRDPSIRDRAAAAVRAFAAANPAERELEQLADVYSEALSATPAGRRSRRPTAR
jgi:glycosyltransferase involved in cell wall biosynthesis